jgi:hypothetical protein
MNAAFMSFQPHESDIHAVWLGAGEASVTKVRFRCTLRSAARRASRGRARITGHENALDAQKHQE